MILFVEGSWSTCHLAETLFFPVKRLLGYVRSWSRIICFTVESEGLTLETSASLYIYVGNLTHINVLDTKFSCHVSLPHRHCSCTTVSLETNFSFVLLVCWWPTLSKKAVHSPWMPLCRRYDCAHAKHTGQTFCANLVPGALGTRLLWRALVKRDKNLFGWIARVDANFLNALKPQTQTVNWKDKFRKLPSKVILASWRDLA